jgi:DNA-binding transcriptional ArsR family regulator
MQAMRRLYQPECKQIALTAVFQALCDQNRLAIVKILAARGETTCHDFEVNIAKSTLSHHFRVLREAGIIETRIQGTQRYVSLRTEDLEIRFPGLLKIVITATEPL